MSVVTMWKRIRRRVSVKNGLHFDYEVSPHRAFLAKMAERPDGVNVDAALFQKSFADNESSIPLASVVPTTRDAAPATDSVGKIGEYLPFKQSRLKGRVNPLRPPLHLETVLIGRALGQQTGYLYGVGFRVRDDGYVEAEFAEGTQKFESMKEFEMELSKRRQLGPNDESLEA
jgi:hypothetical protein